MYQFQTAQFVSCDHELTTYKWLVCTSNAFISYFLDESWLILVYGILRFSCLGSGLDGGKSTSLQGIVTDVLPVGAFANGKT